MTIKFLAGVDEVGRGCLAGPVMSAAIILNNKIDKKEKKNAHFIRRFSKYNSIDPKNKFYNNLVLYI